MDETLNDLDKAINTLSREKDKLDIALYYTHHDKEKAKDMVAGVYKDMFAVKAKFNASTTYGAFLIFFNIPYCSLTNSYEVMSPSYTVDDLKTKSIWRLFEEEIGKILKSGGHNNEMTMKLKDELANAFTLKIGSDQRSSELKKFLEINDEISANRIIKKFIQDRFGFMNVNLSVDYEQISSLDMEMFSISGKKIEKELLQSEQEKKSDTVSEVEEDDDIDKNEIQLIFHGTLVLSPMKGKAVHALEIGDRIKINLDSSNAKAVSIAKAFKAYHDNKILPITGRIVSIRHLLEGGYKIYCLIAKGIYVKIEEEEESIKIAVDMPEAVEESDISRTNIIIALAVGFFIILFVVLIVMFL
jgi:hypothetical protein